jgi:hypothetical protein
MSERQPSRVWERVHEIFLTFSALENESVPLAKSVRPRKPESGQLDFLPKVTTFRTTSTWSRASIQVSAT